LSVETFGKSSREGKVIVSNLLERRESGEGQQETRREDPALKVPRQRQLVLLAVQWELILLRIQAVGINFHNV
jgi:hypothetical protein